MAGFVAVYDACVLYPAPLRDLLMHLALSGLNRARWTERIHGEWIGALLRQRPELDREALEWTRQQMDAAVPDCLVHGYAMQARGRALGLKRHQSRAERLGRFVAIVLAKTALARQVLHHRGFDKMMILYAAQAPAEQRHPLRQPGALVRQDPQLVADCCGDPEPRARQRRQRGTDQHQKYAVGCMTLGDNCLDTRRSHSGPILAAHSVIFRSDIPREHRMINDHSRHRFMLINDARIDFSRRRFMLASGTLIGLSLIDQKALAAANGGHFSLGVASGSPRPDQVILWTRLAPDPLNGGGMAPEPAMVRVRLARDPGLRDVIIDEIVTATPAEAHSVHFAARGLEPGREYWYQFSYGTDESPVGRTRTSDPNGQEVKIALAYCQHYETGYYAAYRDMAEWLPDCVLHTGDYIYEGGVGTLGAQMRVIGGGERRLFETVRLHNGPEIVTLWDYRNRHALYRSDPDLQSAHAAAPWIVAFDDHEIDNNWASNTPQDPEKQTYTEFLIRKLAALQAYYEHMPIEKPPIISGLYAHLQIYGAYRMGPAQVHMLDTRQYRSDQACGDGRRVVCDEALSHKRTMLGKEQEAWLKQALQRSESPFNVLVTQVWFTPYRYNELPDDAIVNLDSWDGYPAARQNLANMLTDEVSNPVFLTGDWHTSMASTLHQRPFDPTSRRIGHELVGSSISTPCPWARDMEQVRSANPHVSHLNGRKRGYLRTTFTADTCNAEFRVVEDSGRRDSPVTTDVELRTKDLS